MVLDFADKLEISAHLRHSAAPVTGGSGGIDTSGDSDGFERLKLDWGLGLGREFIDGAGSFSISLRQLQ
jgi:hypothetical protein